MIGSESDLNHHITQELFHKNKYSLLNFCIGGRYVVIKFMGGGTFGKVYQAFDRANPDERSVVVKQLFTTDVQKFSKSTQEKELKLKYIENQDKLMRKFNHPNILPWIRTYKNKDYKFIITKYCNQGNLYDAILKDGSFTVEKAVNALKQICEAVATLHVESVIHRDLKPENILIHNGVYILGDFGLSKVMKQDNKQNTICGTAYTRAPQVMTQRYKLNADIYSIGVILYIMLEPNYTIQQRGRSAQLMDLNKISFKLKNGQEVPNQIKQFLRKSLQRDPQRRMNWVDLKDSQIFKLVHKQSISNQYYIETGLKSVHSIVEIQEQKKSVWYQDKDMEDNGNQQGNIKQDEIPDVYIVDEADVQKLRKQVQQKQDPDTQIYKSFQQFHLWAKMAQYIYTQFILPIQTNNLLDLTKRSNIKLLYLLSSRCFLYMSRVKSKSYKLPYERFDEKAKYFLKDQIQQIYEKSQVKRDQYSVKLRKFQDSVFGMVADKYSKFTNKLEFDKQEKIINGIQNLDYSTAEHVQFVQDMLLGIDNINGNNNTMNSRMLAKFKSYTLINGIGLDDTRTRKFQDIVEQFIYQFI